MPEWAPVSARFLEGVQLGLFAIFLAISVLVIVATVRRILAL